jgi:hypothetical protein
MMFEVTEFQKAQYIHNIEWDVIKLIYNELYTNTIKIRKVQSVNSCSVNLVLL